MAESARDILLIHALKARYFRALDTKAWDDLRRVFTDDLQYFRDRSFTDRSPRPTISGADDFVASIRRRHEHSVTVHHGHTPEVELTGPDSACGTWAMFDWVDNPTVGFAWRGFGYYAEDYLRGSDGRWRIAVMRLSRIRIEPMRRTVAVVDTVGLWQSGHLPVADEM